MEIKSKFMTGLVSKIAKLAVRNKLGYDVDVRLNELSIAVVEDRARVHLDVDAEISKDELTKLLKSIGF